MAKMCAVKRVTLALFVCFSGRCNCYALSFCCYSSANIVMILDSWLCIYLSFAPRPSHRPVFDCLQYAKTASNQKLDGGKAWERSCTLVSQARPNQPQHGSLSGYTLSVILKAIHAGVDLVWLMRLATYASGYTSIPHLSLSPPPTFATYTSGYNQVALCVMICFVINCRNQFVVSLETERGSDDTSGWEE